MDPYSHLPPPPAYSEVDQTQVQQDIPECLRINRKQASTPIVQVKPVYDGLEPPRALRHGRSMGDMRASEQSRIQRKPVITQVQDFRPKYEQHEASHGSLHPHRSVGDLRGARNVAVAQPLPPRPQLAIRTAHHPQQITHSEVYLSPLEADFRRPRTSHSPALGSASRTSSAISTTSSHTLETPTLSSKSSSSSIQSAYREARHFVGGLVPHPTESTKHYTILRHSHGLVFYQGNSTTLAITVFADAPLPPERTLWLQNKGWSGKKGMRVKALMGANNSWVNVTPSTQIRAEQLNPSDERAWQRDIASFQKKAGGKIRDHILRETTIVRIPIEAGDGYFQLVLCLGEKKKILCTSPTFRVVSTSAAPYSIKGASLRTLPLELGALAISTYARNTAGRVLGPASIVSSIVQNRVQKYMPSFWVEKATQEASGIAAGAVKGQWRQGQPGIAGNVSDMIDLERGPQPPYPIHFTCRSDPASASTDDEFTTPTINLTRLPSNVAQRLQGYYFGWCRLQQRQSKTSYDTEPEYWYQVVISALLTDVSQLTRVNISQANKKHFSIRFVRDSSDDYSLHDLNVEIQIMGFIRPDEPLQREMLEQGIHVGDEAASEAALLADVNDMAMTLSVLDHPAWTAEPQVRSASGGILGGGPEGMRMTAQRQLSKIPLHKIGLRSPMEDVGNGGIVSNGFYIVR